MTASYTNLLILSDFRCNECWSSWHMRGWGRRILSSKSAWSKPANPKLLHRKINANQNSKTGVLLFRASSIPSNIPSVHSAVLCTLVRHQGNTGYTTLGCCSRYFSPKCSFKWSLFSKEIKRWIRAKRFMLSVSCLLCLDLRFLAFL